MALGLGSEEQKAPHRRSLPARALLGQRRGGERSLGAKLERLWPEGGVTPSGRGWAGCRESGLGPARPWQRGFPSRARAGWLRLPLARGEGLSQPSSGKRRRPRDFPIRALQARGSWAGRLPRRAGAQGLCTRYGWCCPPPQLTPGPRVQGEAWELLLS